MSAPTQLNITLTTTGNPVITIAIPAALQSLDSSAPGATQTGFNSVDQLVRSIFRAGVFYDGKSTWYSTSVIQSVTYS
jgi:hypothetical protein